MTDQSKDNPSGREEGFLFKGKPKDSARTGKGKDADQGVEGASGVYEEFAKRAHETHDEEALDSFHEGLKAKDAGKPKLSPVKKPHAESGEEPAPMPQPKPVQKQQPPHPALPSASDDAIEAPVESPAQSVADDAGDPPGEQSRTTTVSPLPATQAADTGEPAPLPVVERKRNLVQSDEVIIRLVDVHKSFGGLTVLDGVCLELYRGHTTVMLGPSGTGKTVLLKLMVGLLKPDSGEVWFDDQRVDKMSSQQLVELRTRIGYLFQMGALFDSMNVRDNVSFPLVEHTKMSRRERLDRCDCVLGMVGLPQIDGKMPSDLSGGQKKRVALARAIVLEPNVVLYDEPTTGLDPIRADLINELINSLAQRLGITSIVVTHDMISANKIADRMLLLYDGQIIADGAPAQFARTDDDRVQRFIKGQAEQSDLDHIWAGSRSPANSEPSPT